MEPPHDAAPVEPEPLPNAVAERTETSPRVRTVIAIGRVRVPLAGPYRPWATLYRLPSGQPLWCLSLWEVDRPLPRCFSTVGMLAYARRSGLTELEREIHRVVELADEVDRRA